MQNTRLFIINITILGGKSILGGGISIMQDAKLIVSNSIFRYCSSKTGTIIYSVNTLASITISDLFIENNESEDSILFFLMFSSINVNGLTLRKNKG